MMIFVKEISLLLNPLFITIVWYCAYITTEAATKQLLVSCSTISKVFAPWLGAVTPEQAIHCYLAEDHVEDHFEVLILISTASHSAVNLFRACRR